VIQHVVSHVHLLVLLQFNSIYLHSIDPARITIVLTDVEIVIISINYLVKECTIIVTIQLITKACIVCHYTWCSL